MRRSLSILLAMFCVIVFPSGAAFPEDGAFEVMKERLESSTVLRADFVQERHLRILKRPLQSSGKLLLWQNEGVLWQISEPHEVTYLIRADEVLEWEGEGGPRRMATSSLPAFRLMTEMFLAALGGDLSALRANFSAELLPSEAGWRVRLRPTTETLAQMVVNLELAGDRYVEKVVLEEAAGDAVHFSFLNSSADTAGPNEVERDYFAQ